MWECSTVIRLCVTVTHVTKAQLTFGLRVDSKTEQINSKIPEKWNSTDCVGLFATIVFIIAIEPKTRYNHLIPIAFV